MIMIYRNMLVSIQFYILNNLHIYQICSLITMKYNIRENYLRDQFQIQPAMQKPPPYRKPSAFIEKKYLFMHMTECSTKKISQLERRSGQSNIQHKFYKNKQRIIDNIQLSSVTKKNFANLIPKKKTILRHQKAKEQDIFNVVSLNGNAHSNYNEEQQAKTMPPASPVRFNDLPKSIKNDKQATPFKKSSQYHQFINDIGGVFQSQKSIIVSNEVCGAFPQQKQDTDQVGDTLTQQHQDTGCFAKVFPTQQDQIPTEVILKLKQQEKQHQRQKQNILKWKEQSNRFRIQLSTYKQQSKQIKVKTQGSCKDYEITYRNISSLFLVKYFTDLTQKVYIQPPGQDPFFLQAYKYVFHLVKTDIIYPPHELNVSKMKTFIIRRILDDYVAEKLTYLTEEDRIHLYQPNRRLTKRDCKNYVSLNLIPPKSRMERSYLQQIFSNREFKRYYETYVESQRLRGYMRSINHVFIQNYQTEINKIQEMNNSLQEKIAIFKKIGKRPFVLGNIAHYESAAKIILLDYN